MYHDSLDANIRAFYARAKRSTKPVTRDEQDAFPKNVWETSALLSMLVLALTTLLLFAFFIWSFTI